MKTGKRDNHQRRHSGLLLVNEYYIMRHGQSEANIGRFICSSPGDGLESCGLTPEGVRQAREAALRDFSGVKDVVVYSSDFLRARQTAETVAECVKAERIIFTPLLRERFFGKYDRGDDTRYSEVWKADSGNPDNEAAGVESPAAVRKRALAAVRWCENDCSGKTILLVSHGDILQILFAAFLGLPPDRHREIAPIANAEIRRLVPSEGARLKELE
ncbi:MAG TPA: histidine phosphatase family protein [Spirochaetota bacterium]|nr:histidine phosphatase family protein [Spirochaetota bacterium]